MAIYSFLTDKDLDVGMKKYFRDQITNGTTNIHIMKTCEGAAFSMIKIKLNNKFDLTALFPGIKQWSDTTPYIAGSYAYLNDVIYKAIQDGTNQSPDTETNYWTPEDPRDQLLVKYAATMTIFFMMESLPPRLMNHDIENEFASVMESLDNIRDGKENPDWKLLNCGGSTDIPWGRGHEKLDHYY